MDWNPYQITLQDFIAQNFWEFMGLMGILLVGAFFVGIMWYRIGSLSRYFRDFKQENKDEHGDIAKEMKEVRGELSNAKVERAEIRSDIKLIKHVVLNGRDEKEVANYTAIE